MKCLYSNKRYLVESSSVYLMSNSQKSNFDLAYEGSIRQSTPICSECGLSISICPGHITSIKFSYPIIHPLFIDQLGNIIYLTCPNCCRPYEGEGISSLLYEAIQSEKPFNEIILYLKKNIKDGKTKSCNNCNSDVYVFDLNYLNSNLMFYYIKGDQSGNMSTKDVKDVLVNMKSYESSIHLLNLLGIHKSVHIEEFLPNIIPVLPFRDRPPVLAGNKTVDNPLTKFYLSLYGESRKMNMENEEETINILSATASLVYKKLALGETTTKSAKDLVNGIIPKLKGELGHKRVLSSIRAGNAKRGVGAGHAGDTSIVVVPRAIIENSSYPELVTDENIDELQEMLKLKELVSVIPQDSNMVHQIYHPQFLRKGDTVMRRPRNGDLCIVNRQPEVHEGSISIKKVVISESNDKTIVYPVNDTNRLGLDFDGDEINIIFPQTLASVRELERLFYGDHVIVKSGNSSAMMGIQFSGITSTYLMSKRRDITPIDFFNIVSFITLPPDNSLDNVDEYPIVTRDSTSYNSEYINILTKYFDQINPTLIKRSIDNDIIDESKFFIEHNIRGLNYYYDIELSDRDVRKLNKLYRNITNMFTDFDEYFTALLLHYKVYLGNIDISSMLSDVDDEDNLEGNITKFKILDFILKEHLEYLSLSLPSVKISYIRKNNIEYENKELDSFFIDELYVEDEGYPNDPEDNRMFINYIKFREFCALINDIKTFITSNIIGIIPGNLPFSISLPKYLNYNQSGLVIKNGIHISGKVKSVHISTSNKAIHLHIAKSNRDISSYYIHDSVTFINTLNRLAMAHYIYTGYTYCLEDITGNVRAYGKYDKYIQIEKIKTYAEIDVVLDSILRDNNDKVPYGLEWESFQNKILSALKPGMINLQNKISSLINYKNVDSFSESGSKGKKLNNDQITYNIGDLFVAGKLYIARNPLVLDHTTLSYTLDSYIDGFNDWMEYVQILSARNAIALRHNAVPTSEYASSTNGIILSKTTTTEDMSTIKITGKYGITGPHQSIIQWHYGGYGLDTTRLLPTDNGYYIGDLDALMKSV